MTITDVGIDPFYEPANYGDWLGANGPRYDSPAFQEQCEHIRAWGIRWQRFNFDFPACCRPANLAAIVSAVEFAIAHEVAPIALFSITGYDGAILTSGLPSDTGLAHYEAKLLPVVEELVGAGVRVFESHNEWNGPGVRGMVDVPRTAHVLASTHSIVHAVAAQQGGHDVLVLPGGTAAVSNPAWYAPNAYGALLADPWGLSFDAPAHHAGAYPYDPHTATNQSQPWNGFYQTQWVSDAVSQYRTGAGKRVWVTEIPWPTSGPAAHFPDEKTAAARARVDLLHMIDLAQHGAAGPVLVYHGCPDGAPGTDTTAGFGMRRGDGTDKAVCAVVSEFAALPTVIRP